VSVAVAIAVAEVSGASLKPDTSEFGLELGLALGLELEPALDESELPPEPSTAAISSAAFCHQTLFTYELYSQSRRIPRT
jgi:hypothetical protein